MTVSPFALSSSGLTTDVVISPDGGMIYAGASDGTVHVYSAGTGELLHTWQVGKDLGGMAISSDGSFLVAVDVEPVVAIYNPDYWPGNQFTVNTYKVELATGAVTTFPQTLHGSEYAFKDIALLSDGTALITGQIIPGWSGAVPLYTVNFTTGAYATNYYHYCWATLTGSNSGNSVLVMENGISDGRISLWDTGIAITHTHGTYMDNKYGYNDGVLAYSEEADLAVQDVGGHIWVFNGSLQFRFLLDSTYSQFAGGYVTAATFSSDGHYLFLLDSNSDTITELSTQDWSIVQTISSGFDVQYTDGAYGNRLLVGGNLAYFTVMTPTGVEVVDNPLAPPLVGLPAADTIRGFLFADQIFAGDGADQVYGFDGDDTLHGEGGNDTLDGGTGADSMEGGTGNDIYVVDNAGDVVIENSGEGTDIVQTSLGTGVDLAARQANAYQLPDNVENLTGTVDTGQGLLGNDLDNIIYAGFGADYVSGGAGNDTVYGRAGDDSLLGGDGNDVLRGQAGADTVHGDAGDDQLFGGPGNDSIDGGEGNDTVQGGGDDDTVYGGIGNDELRGQFGIDTVHGEAGNDSVYGGPGTDSLYGGDDDDFLSGGADNDQLFGENGNDTLQGDLGRDQLTGGAGVDTFTFLRTSESAVGLADKILDFVQGTDKIDLSAIDANSSTGGDQAFSFIGAAAFSHSAGELRAYDSGASSWFVEADVDGDGTADFRIEVVSASPLASTDFFL